MSYIVGTPLLKDKPLIYALSRVLGLGLYQSTFVCRKIGLGLDCRVKDLTESQWNSVAAAVDSLGVPTGPDLQRFQHARVKQACSILSYKGLRHRKGLPVRGQRTHTNAKRRSPII